MTWEVPVEVMSSPVHGTGVFARKAIPAGTVVWRFDKSMHVCDPEELFLYEPEKLESALLAGYLHVPSEKFLWYEDGMQYLNHGDRGIANIGSLDWTSLEQESCVALRDVRAGEELREDYGMWSIFNLPQNHWLRNLYLQHCSYHYFFMQSLAEERRVA